MYHRGAGFTSLPVIEESIKLGLKVLADDGRLFIVTNKKVGGDRHLDLVVSVFGQDPVIVGKGMEGYRVAHVTKHERAQTVEGDLSRSMHFNVLDREFALEAALSLFSTEDLDIGSRFLLESVDVTTFKRLLDVGCGWGAIGIVSTSVNEDGSAVLMDVDTRAVSVAQKNIELAQLADRVEAVATENLQSIDGQFDLILSNPPFHANYYTLVNLFKGVRDKLEKDGRLFIVVEDSFLGKFENILSEVFGSYTVHVENSDIHFSVLMVRK